MEVARCCAAAVTRSRTARRTGTIVAWPGVGIIRRTGIRDRAGAFGWPVHRGSTQCRRKIQKTSCFPKGPAVWQRRPSLPDSAHRHRRRGRLAKVCGLGGGCGGVGWARGRERGSEGETERRRDGGKEGSVSPSPPSLRHSAAGCRTWRNTRYTACSLIGAMLPWPIECARVSRSPSFWR